MIIMHNPDIKTWIVISEGKTRVHDKPSGAWVRYHYIACAEYMMFAAIFPTKEDVKVFQDATKGWDRKPRLNLELARWELEDTSAFYRTANIRRCITLSVSGIGLYERQEPVEAVWAACITDAGDQI